MQQQPLVRGQESIKKRSVDVYPEMLFWNPFGCFTHHSMRALAAGAILMRPKEAVQPFNGIHL